MKNILIFSNPFGKGPAGKAISIAKYISEHSNCSKVYICGSNEIKSIIGSLCNFIDVNERDEADILRVIKSLGGSKYIISSQNRFAINVGLSLGIPTAFFDGLAWFWNIIPSDHFLADIIFWPNYPKISKKIPVEHRKKIKIVHGIVDPILSSAIKGNRDDTRLIYIGGCKNPLTDVPINYLDLCSSVVEFALLNGIKLELATDDSSVEYLKKNTIVSNIVRKYKHEEFMVKLTNINRFITNGGQTATLEAYSVGTPTSFFLPINLSQYSLIQKLNLFNKQRYLDWAKYVLIPTDILNYKEKDAILFFDRMSLKILSDKSQFSILCNDFIKNLEENNYEEERSFLKELGTNGSEDIFTILKKEWGV